MWAKTGYELELVLCVRVCVHVCVLVCIYVLYVCMRIYIYLHICMNVCMYSCINVLMDLCLKKFQQTILILLQPSACALKLKLCFPSVYLSIT